jgi:predicted nucleotidyltransferase
MYHLSNKLRECAKFLKTMKTLRPGCTRIKRCQVLVKVNIMSSDLIGGYLKLDWISQSNGRISDLTRC